MYNSDVLSICNALVDILVEVSDAEFESLGIEKGIMHLVDSKRQHELIHKFKDHQWSFELGGSAMNTTRALAALGSKTTFFGMVGKDEYGSMITDRMNLLGINSQVSKTSDEPTGSCAVLITPDGERTMNTCLGASCHYHEGVIPHDAITNSKILHFTGYQWSTEHQKRAVLAAIKTAKENGTVVSFDVADPFMVRNCREDFIEVIKDHADIVFANREEASELYGTDPEQAGQEIAKTGAIAVIKLGAKGGVIFDPKTNKRIDVAPVETKVIDTTAAGDMFAGGFLYGYTQDKSLAECGQLAALLASDVISRIGARLSDDVINKASKI